MEPHRARERANQRMFLKLWVRLKARWEWIWVRIAMKEMARLHRALEHDGQSREKRKQFWHSFLKSPSFREYFFDHYEEIMRGENHHGRRRSGDRQSLGRRSFEDAAIPAQEP